MLNPETIPYSPSMLMAIKQQLAIPGGAIEIDMNPTSAAGPEPHLGKSFQTNISLSDFPVLKMNAPADKSVLNYANELGNTDTSFERHSQSKKNTIVYVIGGAIVILTLICYYYYEKRQQYEEAEHTDKGSL